MTSTDSAKKLPLFVVLVNEVNYRVLIGLLTVLVALLHGFAIIWLLQPVERINEIKPLKIVEVVLLSKPESKPEPEPKPKVVQPALPKKEPPKKMAGKPPVKEKAPVVTKQPAPQKQPVVRKRVEQPKPKPVIHKQAELPRSQPVLTSKPTTLPAPTTFTSTAKKASPPIHAPATVSKPTASKPVEKTGNGGSDDNNVTSGVVELVQAKPNYPMRAKSRHIEGWVKIAFTVTATGTVTNAHVVGASPPDIFDASALDTIQKFKFKPKMVNGKAVNGEATKTFRFNLR